MTVLKAAVIGYPVQKSKSPIIYRHWLQAYGMAGSYEAIEIMADELSARLPQLIAQGYNGLSVTLPHKQTIMSMCDEIDDTARAIGAVNSIQIKDGKLYATNTDSFGFIQNIKIAVPDFVFKNRRACVLGAGGAARAIIQGLIEQGVTDIIVTNRTRIRAEEMVATFPSLRIVDWAEKDRALSGIDLLVNTTSLGMEGQDRLDISLDYLPPSALVNDIVYYPLMTDLLKNAESRGNKPITGIGMLIHQARRSFHNWCGVDPVVTDDLIQAVL